MNVLFSSSHLLYIYVACFRGHLLLDCRVSVRCRSWWLDITRINWISSVQPPVSRSPLHVYIQTENTKYLDPELNVFENDVTKFQNPRNQSIEAEMLCMCHVRILWNKLSHRIINTHMTMIIYPYTTNLYFNYIMHHPLEVCETMLPKYIYGTTFSTTHLGGLEWSPTRHCPCGYEIAWARS